MTMIDPAYGAAAIISSVVLLAAAHIKDAIDAARIARRSDGEEIRALLDEIQSNLLSIETHVQDIERNTAPPFNEADYD